MKKEPRGLIDRFRQALMIGAFLLIRQSSKRQAKENVGSAEFQAQQLRTVEAYGANPEDVIILDARGKSASSVSTLDELDEAIRLVKAGVVKVGIVAFTDRLSRGQKRLPELYDALEEAGGFVVVRGHIYDLSNSTDRMILDILDVHARFENRQRILRFVTAKMALARTLSLRIDLPSGWVWASPDRKEHRAAFAAAGMESLMAPEELARHKTAVTVEGDRFFILPFPNAEVWKGMQLLARWSSERPDLGYLVKQIETDPLWPRPGKIFKTRGVGLDLTSSRVPWYGGADEDVPTRSPLRSVLRDLFRSTIWRGRYRWRPQIDKEMGGEDWFKGTDHPGAFPTPFSEADLERMEETSSDARWGHEGAAVPRQEREYDADTLRCGHRLDDGRICGLAISPVSRSTRGGAVHYTSAHCHNRSPSHSSNYPRRIDDELWGLVDEMYSPEALDHLLSAVEVDDSPLAGTIVELERRVSDLVATTKANRDLAADAHKHGDADEKEYYREEARKADRERRGVEHELRMAIAEMEARTISDEDEFRSLTEIAGDLRSLVPALADDASARRDLLGELLPKVHITRLCNGLAWVEATFPEGGLVTRVIRTSNVSFPAADRSKFAAYWGDRLPNAPTTWEGAQRLVAQAEAVAKGADLSVDRYVWRLIVAALERADEPRQAEWLIVSSLPGWDSLTEEAVSALLSELGSQCVRQEGDTIELFTNAARIHAASMDLARHWVAGEHDLPPADIEPLNAFAKNTGVRRDRVRERARGLGVLYEDSSGREWVVRNMLPTELSVAHTTESGKWISLSEAKEITSWHRQTVLKRLKSIRPGHGYLGSRSVYVLLPSSWEEDWS